jgi:hypothetical protein
VTTCTAENIPSSFTTSHQLHCLLSQLRHTLATINCIHDPSRL